LQNIFIMIKYLTVNLDHSIHDRIEDIQHAYNKKHNTRLRKDTIVIGLITYGMKSFCEQHDLKI